MKLLLHIGTHKTATTSLQHFCVRNRDLLISEGFYYPENDDSAYVFNFLASAVAFDKLSKVENFLQKALDSAIAKNCHTVILSAESFYAMTGFFHDLQGREREKGYWEMEDVFVRNVKSSCDIFSDIQIICYFRPQDEFASSLYNQLVKNVFGVSYDFEEFLKSALPIFDYSKHIDLWENAFGRDTIKLKNFMSVKKNIIQDFCQSFLTVRCFDEAKMQDFESNTRLNRDVLEVKRLYNATKPDPALAYVSARSFRRINDAFRDEVGYQIFSELERREFYFSPYQEGNSLLCRTYSLDHLPSLSDHSPATYPGLSAQKTVEIYLKFCDDLYSLFNRLEIFLRRSARYIMDNAPAGKTVIQPLRKLHNYLRLRIGGW